MAVGVAPDHAARRVAAVVVHAGLRQRPRAREQRVVVVRPQRDAPSRRGRLEVGRRRPPPERVGIPAATLDPARPRLTRGTTLGRQADPPDQRLDRVAALELDLEPLDRRVGQVQVRVREPRDRDLVRGERDPARPRPRQPLDLVDGARGDDPPRPNRDRLRPRGPVPPRQRRDPADHERGRRASVIPRPGVPRRPRRPAAASAVAPAGPPRGVIHACSDGDRHRVERLRGAAPVHARLRPEDRPAADDRQHARQRHDDADDDQHRRRADEVGDRTHDDDRQEARDRHEHVQDAEHAPADVLRAGPPGAASGTGSRRPRRPCPRGARSARRSRAAR